MCGRPIERPRKSRFPIGNPGNLGKIRILRLEENKQKMWAIVSHLLGYLGGICLNNKFESSVGLVGSILV